MELTRSRTGLLAGISVLAFLGPKWTCKWPCANYVRCNAIFLDGFLLCCCAKGNKAGKHVTRYPMVLFNSC